jgi:hypothetical protein
VGEPFLSRPVEWRRSPPNRNSASNIEVIRRDAVHELSLRPSKQALLTQACGGRGAVQASNGLGRKEEALARKKDGRGAGVKEMNEYSQAEADIYHAVLTRDKVGLAEHRPGVHPSSEVATL